MRSVRLPLAIDTRRLRSFDGTEIVYHVTEAPYPGAPWIVLANGLGGSSLVWRGQIDYLRDGYRFVSWDYRGLYGSERPRPERAGAYSVAAHVRDLAAVLAAERIERADFWGWSAGVQVALEAFPSSVAPRWCGAWCSSTAPGVARSTRSLACVRCAPPSCPSWSSCGAPTPSGRWLTAPSAGAKRPAGSRASASSAARPTELARAELTAAVGELDIDAFLPNLLAFGEHDASAVLGTIDVPVLVIAGDHDPLAARGAEASLARRIRGAELLVLRGGAHCAPIEYPDLISLRIERFYRERLG